MGRINILGLALALGTASGALPDWFPAGCSATYDTGADFLADLSVASTDQPCLVGTTDTPVVVAGLRVAVPDGVHAVAANVIFEAYDAVEGGEHNGALVSVAGAFSARAATFRDGTATNGGAVFVDADGECAPASADGNPPRGGASA